ncbi:multiple sugar transport system permease protein [Thermosporothrix hazakensis]|jgi:multiple sugar transport system permease protein|uniref:Multiple sugar transport system permease protein n=2 Tax=Thermosporothrix hazakensis TaxID=644383 RepID=A0A326U2Y9_THEHA|nr:carbohydrate ABC transporter permease [Thermosporothrix hazakensis]PZW26123.1 multiple sugar transport system permease protein [Thermosporothrix hazakensis]GCE51381.1 sugar ABC transporter permease [Thermosporothrix hazakensis]
MLQEAVKTSKPVFQARRPRQKQRSIAGSMLAALIHVLLIIGAIIMAGPFIWMAVTSLKEDSQAFQDPLSLLPNPIVWQNYPASLQAMPFGQAYWNSFYIAIVVVACELITTAMAGYAFARIRFPGRNIVFVLFLATMMIPFQLTIIPRFLIMQRLGWLDNHLALIVPAALFDAFGVFLMRQFILGIPKELEEAAIIDGASRWQIFWHVILPLLKPPMAALGIFTFLGQWNSFFVPLIMLSSPDLYTVPLLLNQFREQYTSQWALMMAGSMIAVLPVLLVYVLGQRQIIQGIALTGLKS